MCCIEISREKLLFLPRVLLPAGIFRPWSKYLHRIYSWKRKCVTHRNETRRVAPVIPGIGGSTNYPVVVAGVGLVCFSVIRSNTRYRFYRASQLQLPDTMDYKDFRENLNSFKERRELLIASLQELINNKNKLTFTSASIVEKAIGPDVKSSRILMALQDCLVGSVMDVRDQQETIDSNVRTLTQMVGQLINDSTCIDFEYDSAVLAKVDTTFLKGFVEQLSQQYILESNITEKILASTGVQLAESTSAVTNDDDTCNYEYGRHQPFDIDQDALVTMMACFEYPPYLNFTDVDALLLSLK